MDSSILQRLFAALGAWLALAAFALVAATLPATASAAIKLGVFNSGAPANAGTVAAYTQLVGRQPEIVMWYHDFGHGLLSSAEVSTLRATGQAPMVTWEPIDHSLAAIAAGSYDGYLRDSAQIAKSYGEELMVRFAHEMNGEWYPWARSSSYVAAWRHIVSVFRAEGAGNVRWVWAPNVDRTGSLPFAPYFPGEEWVDYVGLDGYNWGETPGNEWAGLERVFSRSYAQITQLSSKPLIITETASSEIGGDKAEWIRTGFLQTIPLRFPRVTGVIWFNKAQEDNWPVTSSQAALDAYRDVVACSLYGGPVPCGSAGVEQEVAVEALHVTRRVQTAAVQQGATSGRRSSARRRAARARPRRRGTISYRLSRRARKARIAIQRQVRGKRFVTRLSRTRRSHRGRNRVALKRLLRSRRLPRGRYRVVVVASDGRGHRSRPRSAGFRVVG